MASISLYESEKIRETLTREQQKQIRDIYIKIAEKAAKEAESLVGKDKTSPVLRRQWLNDMQKKLNVEIENIGGSVQKIITDTMTKAAQAVVDDNISFFEKHNISMKGAFQNVPADVVERVATGKLYSSDWTLSEAIWKDIKVKQKDINEVIAEGIAGNNSSYDIAKALEKYVNPDAKKSWDWSKVYPITDPKWNWTKKTIDYNAQRLARTMVSHAYQQSLVQTVKYNPFVTGIKWRNSNSHTEVCPLCKERSEKDLHKLGAGIFPKDDLPLDHPNGKCTFIPEIGSLDDVAERLADWSNGKPDAELDRFYEKAYQNDTEKLSPNVLQNSGNSGIIDTGSGKMTDNISGAISGALNPNSDEADIHAEKYYELVRKMKTDVAAIARNTNFSLEDIQKVKNYIFLDIHDLGDERIDQFDSDYMMAQSWQRLIDGKDIKAHDYTLLRHELLEREYESQGIPHDKAHKLASEKYNYSEEADNYHAEINKHKET